MSPERWQRIEDVFVRALELPLDARDAFLADTCAGDDELRAEVASLLDSNDGARDALRTTVGAGAVALTGAQIGRRLGPYTVLSLIGEGGMGAVYLAERDDDQFRRRVAIKVLAPGAASRDLVARLRDERQLLATLEHPGIVRLLDGGATDDGLPYLVMEHVDGVPLTVRAHALPVRARVELVLQVADALQYAHQKLIVHRDVKPSNVLVDARGAAKLLDFGIARVLGDEHDAREARTRTGMAMFTVEYASPEQARGEPVSVAGDVYSLGAVLYELLTGRPPQRAGQTLVETLANICDRAPARPGVGDLDNVVLRALAKDPERRYASVAAFADDLRRWRDGLPVAARDATLAYRTRKFVARHRGKLVLGALAVLALTTTTVLSILQARRADQAAERAELDKRALLRERGLEEVSTGHAARALPYLAEALREGEDTAAVRFLLAEALRTETRRIASIDLPDGLAGLAWAPDGRWLATATVRGDLVLSGPDGARLGATPGDGTGLTDLTASPRGDALAAADPSGRVHVWSAAGAPRFVVAGGSWGCYGCIAFTPDGASILAFGPDRAVRVWATGDGTLARTIAAPAPIRAFAVSPDGARVAVGLADGTITIAAIATGAVLARLPAQPGAIAQLAFGRDGTRLYARGDDLRIRDAASGATIATLDGGAFDLDPSGTRLVASGLDSRVYDATTGALIARLPGGDTAASAHWSPDGTRIVTSEVRAGVYRVWDVASATLDFVLDARPSAGDAPHSSGWAGQASFAPTGDVVVIAAGADVGLWRADPAPRLGTVGTDVKSAVFSPDEQRIVTAGDHGGVIWSATGQRFDDLDVGGGLIWDVEWSPDGTRLVAAGADGVLRILDDRGALVHALAGHTGTVNLATWSPDGAEIASAGGDGTARIWDAATGEARLVLQHPGPVMSTAWSPDGKTLATGGWDHHVRLWDASTGRPLADLDGGRVQFLDVSFSPDGRTLASSGHGGEVILWDVASRTVLRRLEGHTGPVTQVAWSPDGALLATGADDQTARIWDPSTGELLAVRQHPSAVMSVEWSRDGTRLLTAGLIAAYLWDVHRDPRPAAELIDAATQSAGGS